jgi:hypothetical protein
VQQIRANPTGPVILRDIAQAEIAYEQMRELRDEAREIMLEAALNRCVPPQFWKASLAVLEELELYTEDLRKVPNDLLRFSILEHYGLSRRGGAGDSGIVEESDSMGNAINSPDLLRPVLRVVDDLGDSI